MTALMPETRCRTVGSPVGPLTLLAAADAIVGLRFATHQHESWEREQDWRDAPDDGLLGDAAEQVAEYFAGARRSFDLPLAPAGTPFRRSVWDQLCAIPYGETISYGELARRVGNANAARAVGLANGKNPIAILIPCHRVIGANGSLVGFGGGLDVKRFLLQREGTRVRDADLFQAAGT